MLQVIFGDDEHTAADGPYARLMKTRKWLYVSAGMAITVASGLYDAAAMKDLVKVIALPIWTLAPTLWIGIAYLSMQYLLLLFQLTTIYDIVIGERLQTRRVDELNAARLRIKEADDELHAAMRTAAEFDINTSNQSRELRELLASAERGDTSNASLFMGSLSGPINALEAQDRDARIELLQTQLRAENRPDLATFVAAARTTAQQAHDAFQQLTRQDPVNRFGYRVAEGWIDFLRLAPPVAVSIYALWRLIPLALPSAF